MNAILKAQKAYAPDRPAIQTPRAIEARVITQITARLAHKSSDFPTLAKAVHDNRMMWSTLAIDVADPGNTLPAPLRAQIFYLAEFTDLHSRKFLRGEADLSALIDINTAIIRGLNASERR
ncbi:MAG: flagellar biosynthesis regulator FlaF [Alphaproteobacteria bacterium]|nr:flagellar biosynthesis regulator FlaF [Alphaproteobacteria bacterium]